MAAPLSQTSPFSRWNSEEIKLQNQDLIRQPNDLAGSGGIQYNPQDNPQGPAVVPLTRPDPSAENKPKEPKELKEEIIEDYARKIIRGANPKITEAATDLFNAKSFQIFSPPNIALGICLLSFAIAGVCWFLNSFSPLKETECKVS